MQQVHHLLLTKGGGGGGRERYNDRPPKVTTRLILRMCRFLISISLPFSFKWHGSWLDCHLQHPPFCPNINYRSILILPRHYNNLSGNCQCVDHYFEPCDGPSRSTNENILHHSFSIFCHLISTQDGLCSITGDICAVDATSFSPPLQSSSLKEIVGIVRTFRNMN